MSPLWTTIAALGGLLLGGGGVLAWIRYFRSEAPAGQAGVTATLADAKLKDAQATEVIAQAFTQTLASVRQLAEDRKVELDAVRSDLHDTQEVVKRLEERLDRIEDFYQRGEHYAWDAARFAAQPDAGPWPPFPADES